MMNSSLVIFLKNIPIFIATDSCQVRKYNMDFKPQQYIRSILYAFKNTDSWVVHWLFSEHVAHELVFLKLLFNLEVTRPQIVIWELLGLWKFLGSKTIMQKGLWISFCESLRAAKMVLWIFSMNFNSLGILNLA